MNAYQDSGAIRPSAGRLWSGGLATAVVAALAASVGILIARGLIGVPVLAPKGEAVWGNANTFTYALGSAAVALVATALMHLLTVATPRPTVFFGWIMVLATLIAVILPLTLTVGLPAKIATALLNLLVGLVITSLLNSTAAGARRRANRQSPLWHE